MKDTGKNLRETIIDVKARLLNINEENACIKQNPDSWSKKEILGHLIDSATNNHQRFVRAILNIAGEYPTYNQNNWVETQKYNGTNWYDLIELFYFYNLHLSRVIESIPDTALNNSCNIGKEKPVTLEFIAKDYVRHLKHHIEKILEPIV